MTEGWTREKAEKLCEAWFDTGARASWCQKMVDEFAAALTDSYQQGRVEGLRECLDMLEGEIACDRDSGVLESLRQRMEAKLEECK